MMNGERIMFEIKAKATKLIDDTGYPEVVLIEFYDYDGKQYTIQQLSKLLKVNEHTLYTRLNKKKEK